MLGLADTPLGAANGGILCGFNFGGHREIARVRRSLALGFCVGLHIHLRRHRRFRMASADETYAALTGPLGQDPYRETKSVADGLILRASRAVTAGDGELPTTCRRAGGIIGKGDYQAIPPILEILDWGQTIIQMGSNTAQFDIFCFESFAHGHVLSTKFVDRRPHGRTVAQGGRESLLHRQR